MNSTDATNEISKLVANGVWSLCAIVGIPANLLVLFVILRYNEMRSSVSNIFLFNLALADMCFLSGTPIVVAEWLAGRWLLGEFVCKLFLSGNGINQFASSLFMGVLSFDRYLAVCHAIKSRSVRTPTIAVVVSVTCWGVVTAEMAPVFMFSSLLQLPFTDKLQCLLYWKGSSQSALPPLPNVSVNLSQHYFSTHLLQVYHDLQVSRVLFTMYSFCLSYLLPLVAIWICYILIINNLWKRRRNLFRRGSSGTNRRTAVKVTTMGFAIVTAYTICWLPYWFVQWSIELEARWTASRWLVPISLGSYALQYVNSAMNPFLYVFLTDSFKQILRSTTQPGRPRLKRGGSTFLPQDSLFIDIRLKSLRKRMNRASTSAASTEDDFFAATKARRTRFRKHNTDTVLIEFHDQRNGDISMAPNSVV